MHISFLCIASLPFSFLRNILLFREVLSFYGRVCQGTAKSWRSPCAILSQGEYSLSIALSYSLRRSGVAISTAMAAGLALASRILMARKPPVGTDYWQELSRAPLLLPVRDCRPFRSCRLSGGRVKRPVASIVRCFPLSERGVVSPTNLCPVRETPLSAYSLPLQGELTFILCMGF